MSDIIRKCKYCGKEFTVMKTGGKKYCSKECQKEINKPLAAERWRNSYKEKRRREREKKKETIPGKMESIAEIQRKARAAGMSYGKYVLTMERGR